MCSQDKLREADGVGSDSKHGDLETARRGRASSFESRETSDPQEIIKAVDAAEDPTRDRSGIDQDLLQKAIEAEEADFRPWEDNQPAGVLPVTMREFIDAQHGMHVVIEFPEPLPSTPGTEVSNKEVPARGLLLAPERAFVSVFVLDDKLYLRCRVANVEMQANESWSAWSQLAAKPLGTVIVVASQERWADVEPELRSLEEALEGSREQRIVQILDILHRRGLAVACHTYVSSASD